MGDDSRSGVVDWWVVVVVGRAGWVLEEEVVFRSCACGMHNQR